MDKSLKDKIIEDLKKTGFGSEMKALKIFHSLEWKAEAGRHYFDKDENISREFDISAYSCANLYSKNILCASNFFHICAQVKKSDKPWVVFRNPLPRYKTLCAWNNIISSNYLPMKHPDLANVLSKNSLLIKKGWRAVGIHEAFKKPNAHSQWFDAFVTVCKACEDSYGKNSYNEGRQKSDNILENPTKFIFFQPIVILDGKLIAADLDKSNNIAFEEIDSAPFEFEFKTKNYNKRISYRIDLVTIENLESYLELVMERQQEINKAIKKNAPYAFKE